MGLLFLAVVLLPATALFTVLVVALTHDLTLSLPVAVEAGRALRVSRSAATTRQSQPRIRARTRIAVASRPMAPTTT
jgi:hypothetical protein